MPANNLVDAVAERGNVCEAMDMGWPTKGGHIPFSDTYFMAEILGPKTYRKKNRKTGEEYLRTGDGVIERGRRRKTRKAAENDLKKLMVKHGLA